MGEEEIKKHIERVHELVDLTGKVVLAAVDTWNTGKKLLAELEASVPKKDETPPDDKD